LGAGNDSRYSKSRVFDPFPFPDAGVHEHALIGALAEELDATRKAVLAEHADLTLTGLYNLREAVVAGTTLGRADQDKRLRGRVDIIAELHRQLDAGVAAAYGWPCGLSDEAIIDRLIALNLERAREERGGTIRWLRPDFQLAQAGVDRLIARDKASDKLTGPRQARSSAKPRFPRDAVGQTAAVFDALRGHRRMTAAEVARRFAQGMKAAGRIEATLAALARLGHVSAEDGGYRLRRVA
jgi:hypothetical protein